MKQILLILIALSLTLLAEFTRDANGVVTDSITKLEWQDDYSDNNDIIKETTWKNAIDYCEALSLAGAGWRLPNINELLSIVDTSKVLPSIDTQFQNTNLRDYWSSTSHQDYHNYAWIVHFSYGHSNRNHKFSGTFVRCVR